MIGRFSALSCSDIVAITSYYEGKAYSYIMMKNNDKINIDLVNTIDTTEHNGVEVKINNVVLSKYIKAIHCLYYMPNIYINSTLSFAEQFNNRKIFRYKNFYCGAKYNNDNGHILLGNIVYPLNLHKFDDVFNCDIRKYKEVFSKIELKFEIGELEVTPTREELKYTDKNINVIKQKIKDVIKETIELCRKENNKDFTDIIFYWKTRRSNRFFLTLGDFSIRIEYTYLNGEFNLTYKGKYLDDIHKDCCNLVNDILCSYINDYIYYYEYGTFKIKSRQVKRYSIDKLLFDGFFSNKYNQIKFIVLPSADGTKSNYFKEFFSNNYNEKCFIIANPFHDLNSLLNYLRFINVDYKRYDKRVFLYVLNQIKKSLKQFTIYTDIVNSKEYIEYKSNKTKLKRLENKRYSKEINGEVTYYYDSSLILRNIKFSDIDSFEKAVKNIHYGRKKNGKNIIPTYIYGCRDNYKTNLLFDLYKTQNILLITVAKTNYKYLKSVPEGFVSIDEFLNVKTNSKYLSYINKCYSARLHKDGISEKHELKPLIENIANFLPNNIKNSVFEYTEFNSIRVFSNDIEAAINETPKEYLSDVFSTGYMYYNKIKKVLLSMSRISTCIGVNDVFMYFAVKNRLLRMDFDKFVNVKDRLFKLQDEKDN